MIAIVHRKFNRGLTSASKTLRNLTTGQGEFSVATLATSEYDLKEAVKKYRFVLFPKVCIAMCACEVDALEML
jgi:hypothetical protein